MRAGTALFATLLAIPWTAHAQLRIEIVSTPSRAEVSVDGAALGRTPIRSASLPPGEHVFVFRLRGYGEERVRAELSTDGQIVGATLARLARLSVRADNLAARGARVRVDGQPDGAVPLSVEVAAGRRLVEAEADGYLTFSSWVELAPGGSASVSVRLEERPPDVGSILVTADVPDAEVLVDGTPRGRAPLLVQGLFPGPHRVEVTSAGGARYEQQVHVRVDARELVQAVLAARPEPAGTIEVITIPPGASVLLDGRAAGAAPLVLDAVAPGEHFVEISLDGHLTEQRVARVEAGATARVTVELSQGALRPGRIVVTSNRADAFVLVDGLSRGRPPLTLERVPTGVHPVRVVAADAPAFEGECVITYGETCTLDAQLQSAPVRVAIVSEARGARLSVDGRDVGALPWQGSLPPGDHRIEVIAPDHAPATRELALAEGEGARTVSVHLDPLPAVDPPALEERPTPPARFVPAMGAEPLHEGRGDVAFLAGWPFFAAAQLGIGLPGPIDIGIAIRTFGRVTELELRSRLGVSLIDAVAIGIRGRFTVGVGPALNAFAGRADGVLTLRPIEEISISLWSGIDLITDEYPFEELDASIARADMQRQNLVRGRIGGGADLVVARGWSILMRAEGVLASSAGRRRLYGDVLELGNPDTEFYGELGFGYEW